MPNMLGHFHHPLFLPHHHIQGVLNGGQGVGGKFHVNHRSLDLNNFSFTLLQLRHTPFSVSVCPSAGVPGSAGHLGDLLGNGRLAGPVIGQGQLFSMSLALSLADSMAVIRRSAPSSRTPPSAEDHALDVVGHDVVQHCLLRGI